ncbi:MAG: InlB B-repeat-containing protein, partial [Thermoplasmata archaeon]
MSRRAGAGTGLGSALLVLLLLVSGFAPLSLTGPAVPGGPHAGRGPLPGRGGLLPAGSGGFMGGGSAVYFNSTFLPRVPSTAEYCPKAVCTNLSDDPSINLTSQGLLVVAYTAFTGAATCAADLPYAQSEVAVVASSDGGAAWTTPVYLGNPVCNGTHPTGFPDAWEPSITSLTNGTLVLAYDELNVSKGTLLPEVKLGPTTWSIPQSRIVVQRSFDGGGNWTKPVVVEATSDPGLNGSGSIALRPWISASGRTAYVTWMQVRENVAAILSSTTYRYIQSGTANATAFIADSATGGSTFASPLELPGSGTTDGNVSLNPVVLSTVSGQVFVAYVTQWTFVAAAGCIGPAILADCLPYAWTVTLRVGNSSTNGSRFSWNSAAVGVWAEQATIEPFWDPAPQLAFNPTDQELVAAYSGGDIVRSCGRSTCVPVEVPRAVFVTNASMAAPSWSTPSLVGPTAIRAYTNPVTETNSTFQPTVAFGPGGVLAVAFSETNVTDCPFGGYTVCAQGEFVTTSSDNGSTFGRYYEVTGNTTPTGNAGAATTITPEGEYATVLVSGGQIYLAWTDARCPGVTGSAYCSFPARNAVSGVVVSSLATGGSLNMTFQESGLPAGASWYADLLGNSVWTNRSALTFSGIPYGENVSYQLMPSASITYGVRFGAGTPSVHPPVELVANRTVTVAYSKQFQLVVATVPAYPAGTGEIGYCYGPYTSSNSYFGWNDPSCPTLNYNISMLPGEYWEPPGRVVTLSVTPNSMYCGAASGGFCYSTTYANLSFISWIGSGSGSSGSLSPRVSATMNGPVNETASFQTHGWCLHTYAPYGNSTTCYGSDTRIVFHEGGLPTRTTWKVTAWNATNSTTLSGTGSTLVLTGGLASGLIDFAVWLVPGSGGRYYLPTPSVQSPIETPLQSVVEVNFTLGNLTGQQFGDYLFAPALPGNTSWSYSFDGIGAGADSNRTGPVALPVGSHGFAADPVYWQNGTGFAPVAIDTQSLVVGAGWKNTTGASQSFNVGGPVMTFVDFAPQVLVEAEISGHGTAAPASSWVLLGGKVNFTEMPAAGYTFDGWSGFGAGAQNSSAAWLVVTPRGPVTEIAVFQPSPATTWNVTVLVEGLPGGVPATLELGGMGYTGSQEFNITGLPSGLYAWAVPTVLSADSNLTQYQLTSFNSTWGTSSTAPLAISEDGIVRLGFTSEYVVTPATQGGGQVHLAAVDGGLTTGPSNGSYWVTNGTQLSFAATAEQGFQFVEYETSGPGGFNGSHATATVRATGPFTELALFAPYIAPPIETYTLTLVSRDRPADIPWQAAVGAYGASGTSTTLKIPGLNGTYLLSVPSIQLAPGVQITPLNGTQVPIQVVRNVTVSVIFTTEFLLSIAASTGGSATPGTEWVPSGGNVTLIAIPAVGYQFLEWNS